jgi:hypothetical protein
VSEELSKLLLSAAEPMNRSRLFLDQLEFLKDKHPLNVSSLAHVQVTPSARCVAVGWNGVDSDGVGPL